MSRVTIEIPSGRWFRGEWAHRPEEDELILAVVKTTRKIDIPVGVYVYDGRGGLYGEGTYVTWENVILWQPVEKAEEIWRVLCGPQEE